MKNVTFILIFLLLLSFVGNAQKDPVPPELEPYFSALLVKDIDSSVSWYSKNLGFTIANKNEVKSIGLRQANLKRGNILIELIQLSSAVSLEDVIPDFNNKTRTIGFFKIGFMVPDFQKWMDHLKKSKVTFYGEEVVDPVSRKKMIIILDPDGNRIQIFEK
ncbi:VOC family protein [Aquimarina sp. AU474]|uniref:VOC family protein n=1 Tax=Aquimarina sp. AU474 TaxID=2108529 RepID=UPI000D687B01|nr:VOC family protein [Aquimarina sp. AU474]